MGDYEDSSVYVAPEKDHLCILVHGLWGSPSHMSYIASALRERYGESGVIVLAAQRNAGSFTYDGIELGAERVAKEIEDHLEELAQEGHCIKKLSMVGYSLGGLVARYACGLLLSRGWFDKIQPVNFTTFATPHLGVRAPLTGYGNQIRNVLGARTLCTSGRQLFMIDEFRDTGRPLLSVLADPDSIFIHALKKFASRCLYANIVNDRSAPYYTTAISRSDPFEQLENLDLNYLEGYQDVVLEPDTPISERDEKYPPNFYRQLITTSGTFIKSLPVYTAFTLLFPAAFIVYLANASVQTVRSRRRIQLFEDQYESHGFGGYRIPFFIQGMQRAVENVYENVNATRGQEYLADEVGKSPRHSLVRPQVANATQIPLAEDSSTSSTAQSIKDEPSVHRRLANSPTLALTSAQFAIVDALDACEFRKYPIHIKNSMHSHAAIIVREPWKHFDEGKEVIKHWLNESFQS